MENDDNETIELYLIKLQYVYGRIFFRRILKEIIERKYEKDARALFIMIHHKKENVRDESFEDFMKLEESEEKFASSLWTQVGQLLFIGCKKDIFYTDKEEILILPSSHKENIENLKGMLNGTVH